MTASAVAADTDNPAPHRRRPGEGQVHRLLIPMGLLVFVVVLVVAVWRSGAAPETLRPAHNNPTLVALATTPHIAADCPWLARAMEHGESPADLARLVTGRMTLSEKLGEIALISLGPYENVDTGVARLCIPPFSLQDGPQGLAFGDVNVTQLPAPLGVAATFDVGLARSYGEVEGEEAAGQGFDLVQGPTLDLLRVPENGRAFEGYGEDPLLVSDLGVADVEGIQSRGVMAQAKEFVAYSQETDRGALDDEVATRPLEELYLRPFEAAVKQANVASVMCAYPQLNGVYQCQDGSVLGDLARWGFSGFVRSDLGAVHDPAAALVAGTDLIKPASVAGLITAVKEGQTAGGSRRHRCPKGARLNVRLRRGGPDPDGAPGDPVDTPEHAAVSRHIAEQAAVLLKDRAGVLPLSVVPGPVGGGHRCRCRRRSGHDRASDAHTWTPLSSPPPSMPSGTGPGGRPRCPTRRAEAPRPALPPVPPSVLTPASGRGQGLTFTLTRAGPMTSTVQSVEPSVDTSIQPYPQVSSLLHGVGPDAPVEQRAPAARSSAVGRSGQAAPTAARSPAGARSASGRHGVTSCCLQAGRTSRAPGRGPSPRPRPVTTPSRCKGQAPPR